MASIVETPPVHYARTDDGVNLAYIDAGSGPTVTVLPFHSAHVVERWSGPVTWTRPLARHFRLVTYDSRGQGLSTRRLPNAPTLADYEADLKAVMRTAGVQQTALMAYGGFAHVALKYYAEHPDEVTALVLICTSETFASWPLRSILSLAEDSWDLLVDFICAKFASPADGQWFRQFMRVCAEPQEYVRMVRAFADSDVSDIIGRIRVPTLVLHSLDQHWLDVTEGTKFASLIPGSQLLFLDGDIEPDFLKGGKAIRQFLFDSGVGIAAGTRAAVSHARMDTLTARQREVYQLLVAGKTNREIADTLVLSERTIERHIGDLYARLGVRNRAEAVALGSRAE